MPNTIRTFIAIDLDPKIRQAIAAIQNDLKKINCPVQWVAPKNMHLTLKFLGDVPIKNIHQIKLILEELFKDTKTIPTELTSLGTFPSTRHPRILWIGLKDEAQQISQLALLLENKLEKMGFKKKQRPFHPHMTIGRVRSPKNFNLLTKTISGYSLPGHLQQNISSVILFKSTLTARGPIYEDLCIIKLN